MSHHVILGTKPGSSAGAASTPNHGALSPVLTFFFLFSFYSFWVPSLVNPVNNASGGLVFYSCMYLLHLCRCFQRPEESRDFPGVEVTGGDEQSDTGAETQLRPARGLQMLLALEPSFQPHSAGSRDSLRQAQK